jgi:hypothetical protein
MPEPPSPSPEPGKNLFTKSSPALIKSGVLPLPNIDLPIFTPEALGELGTNEACSVTSSFAYSSGEQFYQLHLHIQLEHYLKEKYFVVD